MSLLLRSLHCITIAYIQIRGPQEVLNGEQDQCTSESATGFPLSAVQMHGVVEAGQALISHSQLAFEWTDSLRKPRDQTKIPSSKESLVYDDSHRSTCLNTTIVGGHAGYLQIKLAH